MKLIKPKAELLIQPNGLEGIYKQIELAGRTCYESTDKITEDSAKPFVDRMIKSRHFAMLEHGTVYLKIICAYQDKENRSIFPSGRAVSTAMYPWLNTPYCRINTVPSEEYPNTYDAYITTNLRYIWEHELGDMQGIHNEFLMHMCEPTEYHEKRYTFRCITSIGVTREMNRHRVNSIAEQSTRYCNYSKDKFGGEITFCIPSWLNIPESNAYWADGLNYRIQPNDLSKESYSVRPNDYFTLEEAKICDLWLDSLAVSENNYMELLKQGWQPQQAREVLPLCTATEIVHTAFASDWKHFFDLRYFGTTGKPHPNMLQLATLMKEEADKHGIWNEISNSNNM